MSETREDTHFEEADISFRATAIVALATLAALLAVSVGLAYLFDYEADRHIMMDQAPLPRSPYFDVGRFPQPRLQLSPQADMDTYRNAERTILSHYEWVEKDRTARIPIEAAMKHFISRQGSKEEE